MIVTFSRPLLTLGTLRLSVVGSLCKILAEPGVEAMFHWLPAQLYFYHSKKLPLF